MSRGISKCSESLGKKETSRIQEDLLCVLTSMKVIMDAEEVKGRSSQELRKSLHALSCLRINNGKISHVLSSILETELEDF